MAENRKIKLIKNIISTFLEQIIVLVCGIIVPGLMITAYGSESYGALSSITQFLAYISLLECGIGGVARSALYKPLADGDAKTISSILNELKKFFRIIVCFLIIYVIVLASSFKEISRIEGMDATATFILVVVASISIFGQYFLGISNEILLRADQKKYIVNIISCCCIIVSTIATFILIDNNYGLINVKLATSCIFLTRPIFLWLYVKKYYNLSKNVGPSRNYLAQKWEGFGQHIAYFLHSNTDIVVLTIFANLSIVAVYSVYRMIVANMQNLTISFLAGMEALFGDMLARNELNNLYKTFSLYETIISFISVILFSVTSVLITPFIKIYTSGISDVNYDVPIFGMLFAVSALVYCLRQPYHSLIIAAGHFRQTRIAAYGEVSINLILSILLVSRFGLIGVVSGTIVAVMFRFFYYAFYIENNILYRKKILFINRQIVNVVIFMTIYLIGCFVISFIEMENYFVWICYAIIIFILATIISMSVNFIFYKNEMKYILEKFKRSSVFKLT